MRIANRVTIHPDVLHGVAAIEGTRVPVSIVIGSLAGGMTREAIAREYEISEEDIDAALKYAADVVSHRSTYRSSLPEPCGSCWTSIFPALSRRG